VWKYGVCISSVIKFWRSSSFGSFQGSYDDTILAINSTLFGLSETEGFPFENFCSSFDSCYFSRSSYGRFYVSLTWKPANLKIMYFYVELCDGIIRIHLFRTTFLRLSYNPLWDVVPRDNGSIDDLFGWCLIVSGLTISWILDNPESDAPVYSKNTVLPWID
jgi:hypothetical protein